MRDAMWKKVHEELTRLARAKGAYDVDEARWLLEAQRLRVHEQVGYGTLAEWAASAAAHSAQMLVLHEVPLPLQLAGGALCLAGVAVSRRT